MYTSHLHTARLFARFMDNQFSIFGFRFGADALVGLLPGLGDILTTVLSLYLIWVGVKMKLPAGKLLIMIRNIVIDALVGAIPVLGDIGDVILKVNIRNLRILEAWADRLDDGEVIEGKTLKL